MTVPDLARGLQWGHQRPWLLGPSSAELPRRRCSDGSDEHGDRVDLNLHERTRESGHRKHTNGAANCCSFSQTFSLHYIGLKPGHPATQPAPWSNIFWFVKVGMRSRTSWRGRYTWGPQHGLRHSSSPPAVSTPNTNYWKCKACVPMRLHKDEILNLFKLTLMSPIANLDEFITWPMELMDGRSVNAITRRLRSHTKSMTWSTRINRPSAFRGGCNSRRAPPRHPFVAYTLGRAWASFSGRTEAPGCSGRRWRAARAGTRPSDGCTPSLRRSGGGCRSSWWGPGGAAPSLAPPGRKPRASRERRQIQRERERAAAAAR